MFGPMMYCDIEGMALVMFPVCSSLSAGVKVLDLKYLAQVHVTPTHSPHFGTREEGALVE